MILFIHGDSYEWGSGNVYDGSVLAAVGRVVVVTLNYRLGILGKFELETMVGLLILSEMVTNISLTPEYYVSIIKFQFFLIHS